MLSSKERLLRCIRHEPIDRVPITTYELVGWNAKAWENSEPSYRKLMDAIREHTDCIYLLDPAYRYGKNDNMKTRVWREGASTFRETSFLTGKGVLTSLVRTDDRIKTGWVLKHLLEDISDIETFLEINIPPKELDFSYFFEQKELLGDKGLMMISVPDPICDAADLFGMQNLLIHSITETERIKDFLDLLYAKQAIVLDRILEEDVKDTIIRIYGPEYATPPYLPNRYFFDFVTCYLIEMCRKIKAAGAMPRIHSHGKIRSVLDQFAMTDAMMIEPLEPLPDGDIPLKEVKRLYGDRFCLIGNMELKELELSDPLRIDELVKGIMDDAKEGSGFMLMPTAAPINIPLAEKTERNYLQMIESAHKYGKY